MLRPKSIKAEAPAWRAPTLTSIVSAGVDFWLAWFFFNAALTLTMGQDLPVWVLYLIIIEGTALFAERFLTNGGLSRLAGKGSHIGIRKFSGLVSGLARLYIFGFFGSLLLVGIFFLMLISPQDSLVVILTLGRRIWRGYANRPRSEEELEQRRKWCKLEQRIQWAGLIIAYAVGLGAARFDLFTTDDIAGEAVSLAAFAVYFAVIGLHMLFRDPRTDGRYTSKTKRVVPAATVPPFRWETAKDAFAYGYWHFIPGVLFIIFTQEILMRPIPDGGQVVVWPAFLIISLWLLIGGALKAMGRVEKIPDLISRSTEAGTNGLVIWIGGLILTAFGLFASLILVGYERGEEDFPLRAIPLIAAAAGFGIYLLGRVWPAYINPFIYQAKWRGFEIYSPGIAAAWKMTSGAASWFRATVPLFVIGVCAIGPIAWMLFIIDSGVAHFFLKMLLYGISLPLVAVVAADRAWALRLPGLAGIEEEIS